MNYHNIDKCNMLNGEGLRVCLWVSGCEHNCPYCFNSETHSYTSGIQFDEEAMNEIIEALKPDYISGFTGLGGDMLAPLNRSESYRILKEIKEKYPNKNIWLYTGFRWEEIKDLLLLKYVDVLVDGRFIQALADENYPYAGSTNQRIINVQESLKRDKIVLYDK